MKRLLILLLPIVLLSGCLNATVKQSFPDVPAGLLAACPDLKLVDPNTTKLSEVISVVSENYGQYQECQIKIDYWIEWYKHQKEIFNSIK